MSFEGVVAAVSSEEVMPRTTSDVVINLPSSDVVIAGGSDNALVASFGLDGVLAAVVCLAFDWLENDEGLKCCGLAAQHAGSTEDERKSLCFSWA